MFKKLASAVLLLASATSANAAIDPDFAGSLGGGALTGELFVSVFRDVAGQQQSQLIDTGITAAQLLAGTVAANTILGNVGNFFTTASLSSFRFNGGVVINAADAGQFGFGLTTNNTGAAQTVAGTVDLSGANGINVKMGTFVRGAYNNNTNYADNSDLTGLTSGTPGFHSDAFNWGPNVGNSVGFNTEAGLDTALTLFAWVVNDTFDGFNLRTLGTLTAQSSTGNIVFNAGAAPVPVPAAVWLLGSAIVGMGGISRRRKA